MHEPDVDGIRTLLRAWLDRQLPAPARGWLAEAAGRVAAPAADEARRALFLAVSLASRRTGKDDLALSPADLDHARRARPGWDPRGWSCDQAARLYLLLSTGLDGTRFAGRVDELCTTADVGELVALHAGLPLYPDPPRHAARAAEGARSNMSAVFRAVAHANPYPAEVFTEEAWNHMVLKALFLGVALWPIQGLDRRANPALARMLCDYAHERWAAGRPVSPELWRCVGPWADDAALADLERALDGARGSGDTRGRAGAALALSSSRHPGAAALLARAADLREAIEAGRLDWDRLGRENREGNAA